MKIVHVCDITGRGTALLTDRPYRDGDFRLLKEKKKVRVAAVDEVFDFELKGVEAALKERVDYLGFLVPLISDSKIKSSIVGADVELR